jgi:hypothetical protein
MVCVRAVIGRTAGVRSKSFGFVIGAVPRRPKAFFVSRYCVLSRKEWSNEGSILDLVGWNRDWIG